MDMSVFSKAVPEVFLLAALCIVLLLDLFQRDDSLLVTYLAAQVSLWTAIVLVYIGTYRYDHRLFAIDSSYVIDEVGAVLKIGILMVSSLVFIYARKYLREHKIYGGEFYVLAMAAILGMLIMVSGYHLLVLYLGLELLALSMYALVAIQRDDGKATEAAMKYFVLGAVASGLLLYGISILYGMSGVLDIKGLIAYFDGQTGLNQNLLFLFALTFIIAGLAFKLGAVPFHMWMPDVYQGAPTIVTLFLGSAPKIAGLALLIRLLSEGLGAGQSSWAQIFMLLGLLSVIAGNLIAIAQTSLKRMFAYSTIAHMGFVVMALIVGTEDAHSAAVFYTVTYAFMAAGGFAVLLLLGREGYAPDHLDCLKGLNERSPWFALMMLLILFSMAGIPPTIGFYAKLSVIKVVVGNEWFVPAVIMVVMSVVGAFYYLRAIKMMYFDKPEDNEPVQAAIDFKVALSANGLAVVVLGLFPGILMGICSAAVVASGL